MENPSKSAAEGGGVYVLSEGSKFSGGAAPSVSRIGIADNISMASRSARIYFYVTRRRINGRGGKSCSWPAVRSVFWNCLLRAGKVGVVVLIVVRVSSVDRGEGFACAHARWTEPHAGRVTSAVSEARKATQRKHTYRGIIHAHVRLCGYLSSRVQIEDRWTVLSVALRVQAFKTTTRNYRGKKKKKNASSLCTLCGGWKCLMRRAQQR
ncbi:hypothetical protein FN846DRAFT_488845 [Sphaerosporella brunnea]|uniref:Uncharacterized protein n=1 Tax=Sphaerosporella brunnea TaxID=1250544 RepID=A0A5J5EG66_9PEZI|nr:hypothetical protein FN846DRAFT_488845 [Sphaerosporella brunnea]